MSKKIVYAQLHDVFHIPKFPQMDKVLPPLNKNIPMTLTLEKEGVLIKSGDIVALIPITNFKVIQLEKEEK